MEQKSVLPGKFNYDIWYDQMSKIRTIFVIIIYMREMTVRMQ